MTPWLGLDIPLGCQETRSTSVLAGAVAGGATLEQLYLAVAGKAPELQNLDIQAVGADKDQTCIAAICLKRDAEQLEDALRVQDSQGRPKRSKRFPRSMWKSCGHRLKN